MADTFIRTNNEKQGYLGNLDNHTRTQLEELLIRQQKLLNNKSFITKLPDKGNKIQTFVEQLQQKIKQLEAVDQTASLFTQMNIGSETIDDDNPLKQMLNPRIKEKQINYESDVPNSYAKVIQKVDTTEPKTHYRAYQTIKAKNISEVPKDKLPSKSPTAKVNPVMMDTNKISRRLKNKGKLTTIVESDSHTCQPVIESTNRGTVLSKDISGDAKSDTHKGANKKTIRYDGVLAPRPKGTHEAGITLSMEESLNLQQEQAKKQQALQAQQASERLAQTAGIRMQQYNPEGSSIIHSYRDNKDDMSDNPDSDDDDAVDYPE